MIPSRNELGSTFECTFGILARETHGFIERNRMAWAVSQKEEGGELLIIEGQRFAALRL